MKIVGLEREGSVRPLQFTLLTALMALGFGYDLGALFVNQRYLNDHFMLRGNEADVISGTYVLGMLLGLFLGGWLNYGSGRRICIISGALLGLISILTSIFAPNLSILLCTQFVIGFAFGLYLLSVTLYVPEIMQPRVRGFACSAVTMALSVGILAAVLTRDYNLFRREPLVLAGYTFFTLIVIVVSVVRLPESPRFLAGTDLPDAALNALFKLRSQMSIAAHELAGINECYRLEARGAQFFLQNQHFRRSFWTLLTLTLLLHASGFGILPYAMTDLFVFSRGSVFYHSQDFSYGLLKAAFTVFLFGVVTTALMADRLGRRALLFVAALLINISLLILFVSLLLGKFFFAPLIITMGVLLYIFAASIAVMVILFILLPELSPARGREFALSSVLICFTAAGLFGLQVYLQVIAVMGFTALVLLFFVFSILMTVVVWFTVPNTANVPLESIENRLLEGSDLTSLGMPRERHV